MVGDIGADLLDLCSRSDGWDELLEIFLESSRILNVEEDEVLSALRDTETIRKKR